MPYDSETAIRADRLRGDKGAVQTAITEHKGQVRAMAKALGVSRNTLERIIDGHGLNGAVEEARGKKAAKRGPPVNALSEEAKSEREVLTAAINTAKGNLKEVARLVNRSYATVKRRVVELSLRGVVDEAWKNNPMHKPGTRRSRSKREGQSDG